MILLGCVFNKSFASPSLTLLLPDTLTTIKGIVVDGSNGSGVGFVSVVLYSRPDSAFVAGAVSDDSGAFAISGHIGSGFILKITSLGYKTVWVNNCTDNIMISLQPVDVGLQEVVVKGSRPIFQHTTEGLQTNVAGTPLAKVGTVGDMLTHVPGLRKTADGYEVFGRGVPEIYINGRRLHDKAELDRLRSEDIKNVVLITTPGARYGAEVKAVLKIQTRAVYGEGFGGNAMSYYAQSENTDLREVLNWNYRYAGLDVFGMMSYGLDNERHTSKDVAETMADTLWRQHNRQVYSYKTQTFSNMLGMNHVIDNDNSVGLRYTLDLAPHRTGYYTLNTLVEADGKSFDSLFNTNTSCKSYRPSTSVNAYYQGRIGKLSIDFNADYLYGHTEERQVYFEYSQDKEDRTVSTLNGVKNQMVASNLTLGYPVFGGNLSIGAEYVNSKRDDSYQNKEGFVPSSACRLEERNISPFAEYSAPLGKSQLGLGLRYENTQSRYYLDGVLVEAQSRKLNRLFPNVSIAFPLGRAFLQAGYTQRTSSPSYNQLRNNVTYGNRFSWETGNPYLKNELIHNIYVNGSWKIMQFMISYMDVRDAIVSWADPVEGSASIVLIKPINVKSIKKLSANISFSKQWWICNTNVGMYVQKQWFYVAVSSGIKHMNKPLAAFNVQNIMQLPHNWMITTGVNYVTKGNQNNIEITKNQWVVDVGLVKSFCNDKFTVSLKGGDLLHRQRNGIVVNANKIRMKTLQYADSRQVALTFKYNFNPSRSKYKGTGAGNGEKTRF